MPSLSKVPGALGGRMLMKSVFATDAAVFAP
jgi:hypothetical protein